MNEIDTRTSVITLIKKNFIKVVMKEDADVDLPDSKENYEAAIKLTKGERYIVLVDGRNYTTMTESAKEFSSQKETYKNVIAMAIVIDSLPSRILGNFIIALHRKNQKAEMQLFTKEKAAINWLAQKYKEDKFYHAVL
jgi:hypothetical protein